MEEIVNRIRALCRSKNTSITKIEEELHFANGTIGKWKNGKKTPPLEKIILIAERLGTTPEYILRGEQKEKPASNGDGLSEIESIFAQLTPSSDSPRNLRILSGSHSHLRVPPNRRG